MKISTVFAVILVALVLVGCSSESKEERLAKAETLEEVVEAATNSKPYSADEHVGTRYMAIIFRPERRYPDAHLLDVKQAMPVLLERYPQIDRFYFAWATQEGLRYMEVQIEREDVQGVDWPALRVEEIEGVASMYSVPR